MLNIHVLNVGHGDSIVLEYQDSRGSAFAVIDSNVKKNQSPKALQKLQSLNAASISFIAVTHPHADHFLGMKAILEAYEGRIDNLYTFPISQESDKLQEIARKYKEAADNSSDSIEITRIVEEFLHIFKHARKINWESPKGLYSELVAPGFHDVQIFAILPPARNNQRLYDDLVQGKIKFESADHNNLSLAFLIRYKGHQIILGGDGTHENWEYQNKRWNNNSFDVKSVAAKLPHHGSKKDNSPIVLDILYGKDDDALPGRVAFISAEGGSHHPHSDVIDSLVHKDIKPYCTNLAARCGANIKNRVINTAIDPALLRFINSSVTTNSQSNEQPCQGDITFHISDTDEFTVTTEHKHLCPYRGDYSFLETQVQ